MTLAMQSNMCYKRATIESNTRQMRNKSDSAGHLPADTQPNSVVHSQT